MQEHIIETILKSKIDPYGESKEYLRKIIRRYRTGHIPLDDIGIPGGISKALDKYDIINAHVRGAAYSNTYIGTNFGQGSKPKRIYIKSVSGKYPVTDVVCFEYGDQLPREFLPDYEKMLNKSIREPISRIIEEALGWRWDDIDPSITKLGDFFT